MKAWIAILVALGVGFVAFAQEERDSLHYNIDVQAAAGLPTYQAPDGQRWHPESVSHEGQGSLPTVSMSSFANGLRRELPSRVFIILPNNTLEAWGRVNISNGQAQNWGPFPNSYLDARTLSLPAPR